jgi:WD40 repeat protein
MVTRISSRASRRIFFQIDFFFLEFRLIFLSFLKKITKHWFFSAEGFKVGCDWLRAVFSPDGQYAMAGSNDGSLYIWNLKTGQHDNVEKILKEHTTTITCCAWHPQGNQLLSCDKNKKVVLWSDM